MSDQDQEVLVSSFKQETVKIANAEGVVEEYTIREMNGQQRDLHMNATGNRVRWVDGKTAGIKDFNGMQADLLTRCLYGPDGKIVTAGAIQAWPATLVSALYKRAQALNAISGKGAADDAEDEAKNS